MATPNNTTLATSLDASAVGRASSSPFVVVFQDRDPTVYDVQYPIQKIWLNTTTNNFWFLKNFTTSNGVLLANWLFFSYGNPLSVEVDAATSPGTDPVLFDSSGTMTVTGGQVAAGTTTNVIRTDSLAPNTYTIEIQRSQAVASSTVGDNGVSHYNSDHFSVDSNGFVGLKGGGQAIDSIQVDLATPPGTNPVLPNSNGTITITGNQSPAGDVGADVIQTHSIAANAFEIQIQRSGASSFEDVSLNGVCHFNSTQFSVSADGFVSSLNKSGDVRFSARKSADSTNATGDGTSFDIVCDTVIFNEGSGYNGTTGVFTAPIDGDYYFQCIIATDLTTSTPSVGLVNFAGHAFDSNPSNMSASTSTGLSLVYSQFLPLTAGQPVSLSISYSGSTKAVTVQGGSGVTGCFFNGFLIS